MKTYLTNGTELSELIESAVDNAIQKTLPSAIQKTTRRKFKNSKNNLHLNFAGVVALVLQNCWVPGCKFLVRSLRKYNQ